MLSHANPHSDLIERLKNRAATAKAVGNSIPEYALPKEIIELLEEAAHQIARIRSGPSEPLQCLRCGTIDAFGPVSKEKK